MRDERSRSSTCIPALLLLGAAAGCSPSVAAVVSGGELPIREMEIVSVEPPRGVLEPGDTAVARVVLRNPDAIAREVWVGYSVGSQGGLWYDVPSIRVVIPSATVVEVQTNAWVVPDDPVPGSYRTIVALWPSSPEQGATTTRLDASESANAFVVEVGGTGFHPGGHVLGRGLLRPENVLRRDEGFHLRLSRARCEGAEIRTNERYGDGTFSARMRTPYAPGSLSAFFLYEDAPQRNDELDIEILNDGSGKVLLTAWSEGEMTGQEIIRLGFDPSEEVHEYSITRAGPRVEMRIDGVLMASWRRRMPEGPMRVVANVWWPTWLPCEPGGSGDRGALEVERIEIRGAERPGPAAEPPA